MNTTAHSQNFCDRCKQVACIGSVPADFILEKFDQGTVIFTPDLENCIESPLLCIVSRTFSHLVTPPSAVSLLSTLNYP